MNVIRLMEIHQQHLHIYANALITCQGRRGGAYSYSKDYMEFRAIIRGSCLIISFHLMCHLQICVRRLLGKLSRTIAVKVFQASAAFVIEQ